MRATDGPVLDERLTEVFEALGKPGPTPKALRIWFQTLKEFEIQDVVPVLDDWVKRHSKTPAPTDIWQQLNERRSQRIEADAAREKKRFVLEAESMFRRSDLGSQTIKAALKRLASRQHRDPREWARIILERAENGDPTLTGFQVRLAKSALQQRADAA